jgi:hypothetical protein
MNPNKIYESFIVKANGNSVTDNVSVDKGRFIKLFNEAHNKFIEWILDKKNEDDIRYLQPLLVPGKLTKSDSHSNHQLFQLPKNFFDLGTVYAIASGGCCENVRVDLMEIKVENENLILSDSATEPSIDYREAPYYLQNNSVKVFTKDFKVNSIGISYYKYPTQIELIDEEDPESDFKNADADLELDDKAIDRVISIAVSDFDLNTSNPKAQADKGRVVSKF